MGFSVLMTHVACILVECLIVPLKPCHLEQRAGWSEAEGVADQAEVTQAPCQQPPSTL